MVLPVPDQAIRLIQAFEGCERLDASDGLIHAYPDPGSGGETYTIGWGTTRYPDGRQVQPSDTISKEDADKFFVINLQENYWQPISGSIPYWDEMNEAMHSALCSFAYNLGANFYTSGNCNTISACLREKRWQDVSQAMMLYVNPGSCVEAGLRRRRAAEAELWARGLDELAEAATPGEPMVLEAITETFLKKENLDSTQLAPYQLVAVETGRQWKIESQLETVGNSQQIRLAYGAGDWWIYRPHWTTAITAAAEPAPSPQPRPEKAAESTTGRVLAVPNLSQLDNTINPHGSCNVTCVAMCLYFLGMPRRQGTQLEDELYRKLEELGKSRHNPFDLQYLIGTYPGFKDIFRENGSIHDIQTSIDAGNPVIIHGYFTASGHIIVIRGYDDNGFIVNDPNGEWFSSGYDQTRRGEGLHYSYGMISRLCSPESQADPSNIWYHTVFKV